MAARGSRYVVCSSPGEGLLGLGHVLAVEVTDPEKLRRALARVLPGLGKRAGVPVALVERECRGQRLWELSIRTGDVPFVAGLVRTDAKAWDFDLGLIPNAHAAAKSLFPNVSVTTVSGSTVRTEGLESLPLPFLAASAGESPLALMLGSVMWLGRSANPTFERVEPRIQPPPTPPKPPGR